MGEITRYPLSWPDNVGRTAPGARGRAQFMWRPIATATNMLLWEINRLNRRVFNYQDENVIISSNLRLRKDQLPATDQAEPADTGIAVYFKLRFWRGQKEFSRHVVLTCDRWHRVSFNLIAIAKDIEAQRARERWGCTSVEQAFQGYVAIPERCGRRPWWELLCVDSTASKEQIMDAFRAQAKTKHPDKGGNEAEWKDLQDAYEQAMGRVKC